MITDLREQLGDRRMLRTPRRYLENPYASLQLLLAAGCGLLFFGMLMSASTTISASVHTTGNAPWQQLIKEVEFIVLSVPVFWLAVRMPPTMYRKLAYPALTLAVFALVGVLIPGIGVTINGAQRWIQLGPLTIQPSEFAKLAILIWGADLLARKETLRTLTSARHVLLPLLPGFGAMIALVMAEPDLGTSLCFMLLLLGLLWMVGLPMRYFIGLLITIAGLVTMLAVTEPYRLARLTTFMHPNLDPQGAGFHTMQGLYALSSGGIFGVGLGQGTSKYGWVPNANTDYVFAVVGEELGLLGCAVVLALFALFTYSAMRIALRSRDPFVRLVASGAAIWIAGQALINIGYVTALLPVTGIPLPFISNGGTSLILTCAVLGMLASFARHEPAAVKAAQRAATGATTARWVRTLRLGTPKLGTPKAVGAKPAAAKTSVAKATPANKAEPVRKTVPAQAKPAGPRTAVVPAAGRVAQPRTSTAAPRRGPAGPAVRPDAHRRGA
ncbi:MAG: putative lipid II flippase FtsW [Actinomycetota bacterium]|nr:putative lipid II flippase FtsW [Actinomycetota bacterium]MDQ2958265.1 putative lipid II flippase FtsW [Actinomycetota bacterium]